MSWSLLRVKYPINTLAQTGLKAVFFFKHD